MLATFLKSVRKKSIFWFSLSALVSILLSLYSFQIFILGLLFFITFYLIASRLKNIKALILNIIWQLIAVILANLWWLAPFLVTKEKAGIPERHLNTEITYLPLKNTLALYIDSWPDKFLQSNPVPIIFLLIPIFILISIYLAWKKKKYLNITLAATFIYLVSAFLAKGLQPPLGKVFEILLNYFPLFTIFRDASLFFIFAVFGASIIIGIGFGLLIKNKSGMKRINNYAIAFLFILLLFLIILISNSTYRNYLIQKKPQAYNQLERFISKSQEDFRVAWLPDLNEYASSSSENPAISINDLAKNEWNIILNEIEDVNDFIEKPESEYLIDSAGIKYIILPGQVEQKNPRFKSKLFYRNIIKQKDWKRLDNIGQLEIYENQNYYPKFSVTQKINWASNFSSLPLLDTAKANLAVYIGEDFDFEKFKDQLNIIIGWEDFNSSEINKFVTDLNLPISGNYYLSSTEQYQIYVDNLLVEDNIFLEAGTHQIELLDTKSKPKIINLLTDKNNFLPCHPFADKEQFNVINLNDSIEIKSQGIESCLALEINNLQKNSTYQINFQSNKVGAQQGLVKFVSDLGTEEIIEFNDANKDFNSSLFFKTDDHIKNGVLIFQTVGENSVWTIDQLNLVGPVTTPTIESASLRSVTQNKSDLIDFIILEESADYYSFSFEDVEDDFIFSFSSKFDEDWSLSIDDKKISDHLLIGGWSNGWQITEKGDFELELEYSPRQTFLWAKTTSKIWILFLLILLIILIFKKKDLTI